MTRLAIPLLLLAAACSRGGGVAAIPRHPDPEAEMVRGGNYDPVDLAVAWLPSGELVVAHTEQYSRHDVFGTSCPGSGFYAVPADSGAPRPLAVGTSAACRALGDDGVAMSADGRSVVFSEWAAPNNSRLARMELASGRVDTLATGCAAYLEHPAVARDGRIAAMGLCASREQPDYALYVMNADGSGLRQVAAGAGAGSWSPDGRRLAAEGNDGIAVLDADGGGRRVLGEGHEPSWSPDGAWIAFYDTVPGGRGAIGIVRPDGSGRREVFRNTARGTYARGWGPHAEGEPLGTIVWSPDARWIAFSRRFDRGTSLWRVELATGRADQVTRPAR